MEMNTTNFLDDIKKGKVGEEIFKEDFLRFLKINFEDVTGCQQFRLIDSDFIAKIGLYEVKCNYKDNDCLVIEEYTDYPNSLGWFYKSKADLMVFISKDTRLMILLPFTKEFKEYYEKIKNKYELIKNRPSFHNGNQWQSAFRKININDIAGYYSKYKKVSP